MSLVTIQNKLSQTIAVGLVDEGNPAQTVSVKLGPRNRITGVESTRVTEYTKGLARQGRIIIIPESA